MSTQISTTENDPTWKDYTVVGLAVVGGAAIVGGIGYGAYRILSSHGEDVADMIANSGNTMESLFS